MSILTIEISLNWQSISKNDKEEEEEDDYTGICKISPSSSSNSYALSWKKYKWMEMNPLEQTPEDTIHGE